MLPVVALVGRPNVGKSTLFNALTRTRDALVADFEGLTRDRRYGVAQVEAGAFAVVDTGGLTGASEGLEALAEAQVRAAIEEADLLLFMVDGRAGLGPEDERIARDLRATGKPVMVVVNKVDGIDENAALADFFALGFEAVVPIAAAHRRGMGALTERILKVLPVTGEAPEEGHPGIRVALLGRPNVGKSTLINRFLGEQRVVAYDQPGTTRDTVEIPWRRGDQDFVLLDTAGVRRRSRTTEAIEKFSVLKALDAIQQAHVVVVLMDARDGVVEQDVTLLGHVLDAGRALVVAVNKWDGLETEQRDRVRTELDRRLTFLPFAELRFISARHGTGVGELVDAITAAYESSRQELSTSALTEVLLAAYAAHQPPMVRGRTAKLRYAHLGGHDPLTIIVHGNRVDTVPESYKRFLANRFREAFDLVGTPLQIYFRSSDNPYAGKKNRLSGRQQEKRRRLIRHVKRRKR
ncbi:MAG: ribosome biogenesis GTPase Der [Xanthomonadales bacterium]|nr:ribosome biogenesis GTPase Der [Xanthomonadales bacterium]